MNRFEVVTPADVEHASAMIAKPNCAAIAGGVDVLDLQKLGVTRTATLVNLKPLAAMNGIDEKPGGDLRLGALVKLHEVAEHPVIRKRFSAISDAARQAATPQIRNLGTVGGNLLQRPRCWYFRNPLTNCLKKGGDRCFSVGGLNRYHAIFGGGPSFIVHPSNLAPALVAFGASAHIVGPGGVRTVELEKFFALPSVDPHRENDLKAGEIITEIIVPAPARGARSIYIEAREKQSFDWPLVSVAAVIVANGKTVSQARIVMGAVAPIPWRVPDAERTLAGMAPSEENARAAAKIAIKNAAPLPDNGYKVKIAEVLVRRAILGAASEAATASDQT